MVFFVFFTFFISVFGVGVDKLLFHEQEAMIEMLDH